MATKSYAERITKVKLMLDAMTQNKSDLPKKLDDDYISQMQTLKDKIEVLNTEQEKLKADLKSKTEALNKEISALDKLYSEAKKRIKLDFEQTCWIAFGIEDKR
ncbi:membrane-binding protein [Riemerella anatipestifer]|uniref:Membrane-binding protein n=1 Tax=Riemerella anatipestifer (strain ATCC 11845 / DSM 15868 / JCM 9532 / NCTC 11014) TaxID=693978 RepID=E4TAD6_RIEAD|nr:hypothetical protein [Riemerella anatipestifer]ADQ82296.1 hypothetical protein Riean_1135 [Riemerella anatipestifer ATCC 11845 = DSM 15868]ADZ12208.1 hypothetical protein RIA_1091 [Riemerella anatipestifer RA-GD]AFD56300.1 hypothetical protein RA0C_1403 [Riemerella anatipestifer ATCC 11845 = DSM 15868]MCE4247417.1 membrane-binding protein [Riemerella anatipestifer]MRM92880.1 membrane-binding protein [Riemerella anatipestifer]